MMARIRHSRGAVGYYLVVLIVAAAVAWVAVRVAELEQQVHTAETTSDQREGEIAVLSGAVDELRDQVLSLGEEPVAPPPEDVVEDAPDPDSSQGPEGKPGRPPTAAEIRAAVATVLNANPELTRPQIVAAVADYLQANPPADGADGADGVDGTDGRTPTADEVLVAVAAFCADGACDGPPGQDGSGPSDEQIAAAVATYCDARGECRGQPGQDGADGTDGTDGVGLAAFDCNADNDWLITYTDGTTDTVEGPCRAVIVDPPTP